MCTVSFIPQKNKAIISSNRDEKQGRSLAIPPKLYHLRSGKSVFPKDADAGGTWLAVHENGNMVVFLNGAFVKHEPKPPYRKSRGLVLIDLIDQENPYAQFLSTDLLGIEPFTAIIYEHAQLYECRWDGQKKYHTELDPSLPHIWSSATLYDDAIARKRKQWFTAWLEKNPNPTETDILHFHQFTGDGDKHNDLLMDRDGLVATVSISLVAISDEHAFLHYLDIKANQSYEYELALTKATAP